MHYRRTKERPKSYSAEVNGPKRAFLPGAPFSPKAAQLFFTPMQKTASRLSAFSILILMRLRPLHRFPFRVSRLQLKMTSSCCWRSPDSAGYHHGGNQRRERMGLANHLAHGLDGLCQPHQRG